MSLRHRRPFIFPGSPTVPLPFKLSPLMPIVLLKFLREVAREKGKELRENLKQH